MTALAQLVDGPRNRLEAVVELTVASFDQRLMQIALGEIARGIIGRKRRSSASRLFDGRRAGFPGRLFRSSADTAENDLREDEQDQ